MLVLLLMRFMFLLLVGILTGRLFLSISFMQREFVNIVMFDSMFYSFVQIVEEVIKLMINFSHQCLTFMGINIVIKIDITMITRIGFWMVIAGVRDPEVTFVGVLRHGQVSFMFPVRMCVLHPIVRSVLDAMHVVVLVNMLRMVLTIVAIGVIVAHMMSSLRFNIVILTVFLS